jgi:hypothetical protein
MLVNICNVCDRILLSTPRNIESSEGRQRLIEENRRRPLSHYMICESDRLRVQPDSVVNSDSKISFTVKQQVNAFEWIDHEIVMPSVIQGRKCKMEIEGPVVALLTSDGRKSWFDNTFLFLEMLASEIGASESLAEILKLTVMYVGQTEISDTYVRFDGHEKLNAVFGEVVDKRPHREVWVKMLSFQPPFTNMLSLPEVDSPFREDWLPGGGLIEDLPQDQLKNAVEGVLIKYFQPVLNIQLKKNFPSDRHTSYKYFYERNVRSIVVELHEEWRSYITGNQDVPYTKIKFIEYSLSQDDVGPFLHDNSRQDLDDLILKTRA